MADLHSSAVCVSGRQIGHPGGTPFSPGMGGFPKTYEILLDATECACGYYRRRNTGNKQWDQCPDCTFVRREMIFEDDSKIRFADLA